MYGNQGYGESEREFEIAFVMLLAGRKLSKQIERALKMTGRLGMGGSANATGAGATPRLDRRINQARLRKMMRQDLGLRVLRGTESLLTHCWREMDSNHRSPVTCELCWRGPPLLPARER